MLLFEVFCDVLLFYETFTLFLSHIISESGCFAKSSEAEVSQKLASNKRKKYCQMYKLPI